MKKFILLLFSALLMQASYSQESSWTYTERNDFITNCVDAAASIGLDSAKFYCYCMLGKIEKKYPDPAKAALISESDLESPEWKKMIQNCLGQNWPSEYRRGFLSSCIETAKANLGETAARSYCECMMFKLELKYPNYKDADNLDARTIDSPEFQQLVRSCLKPAEK